VPQPGAFTQADEALLASVDGLLAKARVAMGDFAIHNLLGDIWAVIGDANRYFAGEAPWVLRKSDPARMATVLYVTAEALRSFGILCQPVLPEAAGKLLDLVAVAPDARSFDRLGEGGRLVPGTDLPPPAPIFPRYVEPEETTIA
jgi:methionyl-tRNA synthetase